MYLCNGRIDIFLEQLFKGLRTVFNRHALAKLLQRPGRCFPVREGTLIEQSYASGFAAKLARDVARFVRNSRYARPDGYRLRFVIYRPEDLPDPSAAIPELRAVWHELGLRDVEVGTVYFHVSEQHPIPKDLVDFWIEIPPHGMVSPDDYLLDGPAGNRLEPPADAEVRGLVYDYASVAARSLSPAQIHRLAQLLDGRFRQAMDINMQALQHSAHQFTPEAQDIISRFILARDCRTPIGRVLRLYRAGVWRQGKTGTAALYLAALIGRL